MKLNFQLNMGMDISYGKYRKAMTWQKIIIGDSRRM